MANITVLRTREGYTARKTITPNGTIPFQAGSYFTFEVRQCDGIEQFAVLLAETEADPQAFVIRGRPLSHVKPGEVVLRRRHNPDAAFEPQKLNLICCDMDKLEAPEGMSPIAPEAIEYLISRLPSVFHNASYVAQWSSSAGRDGQKIRVHIWFWTTEAQEDDRLEAWAVVHNRTVNPDPKKKLIDPAIFRTVQPHYTARPQLIEVPDPFEGRSRVTFVRKRLATVALQCPERQWSVATQSATDDPDIVRDEAGKIVDGREAVLRDIRFRILQHRRPKTIEQFTQFVWEEFSDCVVLGATTESNHVYDREFVARSCANDNAWKRFSTIVPEPGRGGGCCQRKRHRSN